ncbi:gamma-aminobutyric acid receptor subunit delta [Platysternon megacephalum]|uniref:Gamma-aminobutyric acid receptor subunit delta n=1 Tax=Platysternon megacephalum TaxID=55544 RepID=A0A4D9F3X8_9SAUR|nr:gamma-aminobutyric acid receptor subunit delta [Platysternon megacephalum]
MDGEECWVLSFKLHLTTEGKGLIPKSVSDNRGSGNLTPLTTQRLCMKPAAQVPGQAVGPSCTAPGGRKVPSHQTVAANRRGDMGRGLRARTSLLRAGTEAIM